MEGGNCAEKNAPFNLTVYGCDGLEQGKPIVRKYIDNIIKRASARVPPTPPSLGHNAIMLGLLEVVMLNVGQSAMGRVHAIRDRWFKATL